MNQEELWGAVEKETGLGKGSRWEGVMWFNLSCSLLPKIPLPSHPVIQPALCLLVVVLGPVLEAPLGRTAQAGRCRRPPHSVLYPFQLSSVCLLLGSLEVVALEIPA